jgi:hypothetical protein
MLVDGGVHGLYPINLLTVEEQKHALGIMLTQELDQWTGASGPDAYILRLYEIASAAKNELVAQAHAGQTIRVVTPKISMVEFTLTAAQRVELYQSGVFAATAYLARLRGTRRRRASIS